MTKVTLYRYEREPGKTTTSPIAPPEGIDYTTLFRLIADEGMELVKDDIHTICIDTEDDTGWVEVPLPEPNIEEGGDIECLF